MATVPDPTKKFERELVHIVKKIVDFISVQTVEVDKELRRYQALEEETIEKHGSIAVLKIRKQEVNRLRKEVKQIIKKSTNRLVIATITESKN
jgi:hypothetical protein